MPYSTVFSKYEHLGSKEQQRIPVEYVFIDVKGQLRSKTKTLTHVPKTIEQVPPLDIMDDLKEEKDIVLLGAQQLTPIAMYKDPFRPHQQGRLVLCEHSTRQHCKEIMEHFADLEPWFGMEQEYVLFDPRTNKPLGWPSKAGGEPEKHGKYYCGVGAGKIFGRDIIEAHYRACLFAGLTLCGSNAEVTPGQLEYQIGPCAGVTIGDELWMARYIMERITEEFELVVTLHPKPMLGDWNPTGCHTNFSTNEMRSNNGLEAIDQAIENMSYKHFEHIKVYGQDNELRLTGEYETGHISVFSYGVGNRGASIRIPRRVVVEGKGYMEDRRPAGNIDPYQVATIIMKSSFNYKSKFEQEIIIM